jgi:signal transduction histidine kinase
VTESRLQEQEQQILLEISNALNSAQNANDMLKAIMGYAQPRGATSISLIYFDLDKTGSDPTWAESVAVWAKEGYGVAPEGMRYYLPEIPSTKVWFSDLSQPVLFDDMRTSPYILDEDRELYLSYGTYAGVVIPLHSQGRWLGIYMLTWGQVMNFTTQDKQIFRAIMRQATPVVDAIRTTELVQKAAERAEILSSVNASLSQSADEDAILQAISPLVLKYKIDRATLLYVNPDLSTDIAAAINSEGQSMPLSIFPSTHFTRDQYPIVDTIYAGGSNLFVIESLESAKEMYDQSVSGFMEQTGIQATVTIPLMHADTFIGQMNFSWQDTQTFDPAMLSFFKEIQPSISSTVSSRQLYLAEQAARRETERRAAEMELVARVGTEVSTNLNVADLLQSVTDLIKVNFDLYHAHIYLYDEVEDTLNIAAGSGVIGRQIMKEGRIIPLSRPDSLVAQAGRTLDGLIVNDVLQNPNFLPHRLLPETRSEMAIPMVVGNTLIGVLDIQADKLDFFTQSDIHVHGTLASQIAVAIQNVRSYEAAKESDRLKSEFLANMSHELRTPLNSIIGYSEVLLEGIDGELSPDAIEDVSAIHGSGQHLLMIINDILDLAKIEARQMHIDPRPVDLARFMQEILHAGQILVKDKDVELLLEDPDEQPTAYADSVRLRQIVWNIISNAVKFTESGSVSVSVSLHDEDHACVRVKDTGIGIRKEDLSLVFEQFQQVDGSSTRRAGGTGLGLAITRHLVEMHGGEINVESEYGHGTTFWFTLPLYKEETVKS